MELIETPIFSRQVDAQLSADEYRALQLTLLLAPEAGPVIPGSGDFGSFGGGSLGGGSAAAPA